MIAFSLFWFDIYRYSLMYLVWCAIAYAWLTLIARQQWIQAYPKLHTLLDKNLDNLFIALILWVIVWWRLGHVLIYAEGFDSIGQALNPRNGGMSFVGGVIGVIIGVFCITKIYKLTRRELWILFDSLALLIPAGIFFGRIGNFLNQELIGEVVSPYRQQTLSSLQHVMTQTNLRYTYDRIDAALRRNANFFEAFGEWLLILIILFVIWKKTYNRNIIKPWYIAWRFMTLYGVVRFILEYMRDNPPSEYFMGFHKTGYRMIAFVIVWIVLIRKSRRIS